MTLAICRDNSLVPSGMSTGRFTTDIDDFNEKISD